MRKNISIIECFGVFSTVIAFAGSESRLRAARTALPLDSTLHTDSCGLGAPVSRGSQEAPRGGARQRVCKPAVPTSGQTVRPPHAQLVDANGFFAGLVLRRVRARDSAASHPEPPDQLSDHPKLGLLAAPLEVRSPPTLRSARPVPTAWTSSADAARLPLETQLAELARRRLRSPTTGEKPG